MADFVRSGTTQGRDAADRVHHADGVQPAAARPHGQHSPTLARRLARLVVGRRRLQRLRDRRQPRHPRAPARGRGDRRLARRPRARQLWDRRARRGRVYEQATLYDEHTWGAFASIAAPDSLWTQGAVEPQGRLRLHASMETHDVLARRRADAGRRRVAERGHRGDASTSAISTHAAAYPAPEPNRAAGHQHAAVAAHGHRRRARAAGRRRRRSGCSSSSSRATFPGGRLPPGDAVPARRRRCPALRLRLRLPVAAAPAQRPRSRRRTRSRTRTTASRIDPQTGALARWVDKALGHDFAGEHQGWRLGQYVYERVESGDRDALFVMDFSRDDFGVWPDDPPFRCGTRRRRSRSASRSIHAGPRVDRGRDRGRRRSRRAAARYALESGQQARSESIGCSTRSTSTDPESVYVALPVRSRRASLPGRPQRHPVLAERGPAQRHRARLVPGPPLGRRQRRRARRHGRSARCAAGAARRDHDRQVRRGSSTRKGRS